MEIKDFLSQINFIITMILQSTFIRVFSKHVANILKLIPWVKLYIVLVFTIHLLLQRSCGYYELSCQNLKNSQTFVCEVIMDRYTNAEIE